MKRKMGCLRDKLDERDFLMRSYLPLVKLPVKVDHTAQMSPVRDQGDEGTINTVENSPVISRGNNRQRDLKDVVT